MRRRDKNHRLIFIDISNGDNACPIDRAELLARFHIEEDGKLVSGAAAFAAIWRELPLLRPLGLAARNRFILALFEQLYRLHLRIRPQLQRFARKLERN